MSSKKRGKTDMFQIFKADKFDQSRIQSFVRDLDEQGVECRATWKRGRKEVAADDEIANSAYLSASEGEIFRQVNSMGSVQLRALTPEKQTALLQSMKRQQVATRPNWALAIGLLIVYWFIVYSVAIDFAWLFRDIVLSAAAAVGIACAALHNLPTLEDASDWRIPTALIVYVIAVVLTLPASLLTLPLLYAILRDPLYQKIQQI